MAIGMVTLLFRVFAWQSTLRQAPANHSPPSHIKVDTSAFRLGPFLVPLEKFGTTRRNHRNRRKLHHRLGIS